MSWWPALRKRFDAFGETADAETITTPGFYQFYLGTVITPGAANWVLDRPYLPPTQPLYGGGTPYNPWAWPLPGASGEAAPLVPQYATYGSAAGSFPIEQINTGGVYG